MYCQMEEVTGEKNLFVGQLGKQASFQDCWKKHLGRWQVISLSQLVKVTGTLRTVEVRICHCTPSQVSLTRNGTGEPRLSGLCSF